VQAQPLPRLAPLNPPPASPVIVSPSGGYTRPAADSAPDVPAVPIPTVPVARPNQGLRFLPQPPETAPKPAPPVNPPGADKPKAADGTEKPGSALPSDAWSKAIKTDVFRFDGDDALDRRILRESGHPASDKFPDYYKEHPLVPPGTKYEPKTASYPPTRSILDPTYVVHRRLYFEERNAERAAWDAGPFQMLISTSYFYWDAVMLPHNFVSGGFRERYETSAGKCLPGDPTPYLLYPPGLTRFGMLVEGGFYTGLLYIFPGPWGAKPH
jgi:hypothetical protein